MHRRPVGRFAIVIPGVRVCSSSACEIHSRCGSGRKRRRSPSAVRKAILLLELSANQCPAAVPGIDSSSFAHAHGSALSELNESV